MNTEEGKRLIKWGSFVLVILAVFLAVSTISAFRGWRNTDPVSSSISVTGEGEVIAVSDLATFTFTVSADAATVSAAQETVTGKINAILAALKGMGVEEKDIKTSDYSVWPKYSYSTQPCGPTYCPPSKQTPDGYTASHNVVVKVRKTEEAGKALGVVGEKGATNISGISFTTDDPDALFQEARVMAIKDAKGKAEELADSLDVKLVRVVSYSDNSGPSYPVPMFALGSERATDAKSTPTIPQGENKIIVNVTVTYEIR